MPEQLLLPGIDPPPAPLRRARGAAKPRERLPRSLFFAILPPPAVAEAVAALAAQLDGAHSLKAKLTDPERLHVTLHHLGDYTAVPRKVLQAALDAAATVAPPAFEIAFDEALRFDKSRAFVLASGQPAGTAALVAFRQRLGEALADAGFKPERGFTPHMTLGYTPRKVALQPVAPALRWHADAFVLLESHVGEHIYEPRGKWPA
ncbi:2'-5' RNA ligase [Variovorax sp. TBS-050B]|uniref:RNA 2',3'-cyclic phosphodiesterase n=1 Tax=Variovorax sp. TBS-050B TaxID=2940551 RepID=UPI00247406A5|nr:RNA 2',3'-cyclic phosphodiesterase [Variovorax sp. TBS-050B]MDH6594420.1 2'-5' RNA ligase [Variovorax sp. TBS-050B]